MRFGSLFWTKKTRFARKPTKDVRRASPAINSTGAEIPSKESIEFVETEPARSTPASMRITIPATIAIASEVYGTAIHQPLLPVSCRRRTPMANDGRNMAKKKTFEIESLNDDATELPINPKSQNHQYSLRDARPENVA